MPGILSLFLVTVNVIITQARHPAPRLTPHSRHPHLSVVPAKTWTLHNPTTPTSPPLATATMIVFLTGFLSAKIDRVYKRLIGSRRESCEPRRNHARADLAVEGDDFTSDLFQSFPITNLEAASPIRKMLRKPDFQRETNHWRPRQIVSFISSFLDNELIPSLILWKSPTFIFVIDGGHRLSALRAWMEDDYGDGHISQAFYKNEISDGQIKIAKQTRRLVEKEIGRFSTLKSLIETSSKSDEISRRRSNRLFTRSLSLQWVQGNAEVAEISFFKINSQGTPLDDTEETLLRNRRKPIAISARAIIRAGQGHKYWSAFPERMQEQVQQEFANLFELLFEPEVEAPLKTIDIPIGASVSPVDALDLLIVFLTVTKSPLDPKPIQSYEDDLAGNETLSVLRSGIRSMERITSSKPGSLGLHPAVYFYNEKGKHSRFLFLGVVSLISIALSNNNKDLFFQFTKCRSRIEIFLVGNNP